MNIRLSLLRRNSWSNSDGNIWFIDELSNFKFLLYSPQFSTIFCQFQTGRSKNTIPNDTGTVNRFGSSVCAFLQAQSFLGLFGMLGCSKIDSRYKIVARFSESDSELIYKLRIMSIFQRKYSCLVHYSNFNSYIQ